MGTKQPHYVMCGVCNDILYAGPGINPIPRECECTATIVIPTPERGLVRWDAKKYKAAADEAGAKVANEIITQAVKEELGHVKREWKEQLELLAAQGEDTKELVFNPADPDVQARVLKAKGRIAAKAQQEAKKVADTYPKEPEIEYTEKFLDPMATRVAVPDVTLDQIYEGHMQDRASRGPLEDL